MRRFAVVGIISAVLAALPALPVFNYVKTAVPDGANAGQAVLSYFTHLVAPRDGFMDAKLEGFSGAISAKLPYEQYIAIIGRLKDTPGDKDGSAAALNMDVEFMGQMASIGFGDYLAPYLPTIRGFSTGMMVLLIAFFNYRMIYGLFNPYAAGAGKGGG